MALPNPIPDNPTRWGDWRNYNSTDFYARLCLSYESNPSPDQIEENCRQLLVWWQKKLPLKNQPSNPLSQMLRAGLDEAPVYLAEARTKLLDPEARAQFDQILHGQIVEEALREFRKLLVFSLGANKLREEDEQRLYERGRGLGLTRDGMEKAIEEELARTGSERVAASIAAPIAPQPAPFAPAPVGPVGAAAVVAPGAVSQDPFGEFRRMVRLSKLCLEGDDMTDDQRDALCNMGESLGLTGGQAEDLIDEYLDEVSGMPPVPVPAARPASSRSAPAAAKPAPSSPAKKTATVVQETINISPLARLQERQKYPNFASSTGIEMLLIPSGVFQMGSNAKEASSQEQPITQTSLSCFYLSRFPVTNAQFEQFDPAHRGKRANGSGDNHPVVYVTSREAEKFCQWLNAEERKKYRLPSEAEWEYAARGMDGRTFPWGEFLDAGNLANFADARTSFAWRDPSIDDGFAESSPVGSYPRGVSPFGIEDMAGNVFEWCLDFFEMYKGKDRLNPRGPNAGQKRVYRGGSWKSRAASLRTTARNFNQPEYCSNDVGFRIVCECDRE